MSIFLQTVKVEGAVKDAQVLQLDIWHEVNECAVASLSLSTDAEKAQTFLSRPKDDPITISAKDGKKDVVLFCGYLMNAFFEARADGNRLVLDLCDSACLLKRKRMSRSFQNLEAEYEDILKESLKDVEGTTLLLNVDDKEIGKMIVQLNETPWEFLLRMASRFSASVFTDLTAPKPLVTIGLPEEKGDNKVEFLSLLDESIDGLPGENEGDVLIGGSVAHEYDDEQFNFFNANKSLLADGVNVVAEDFSVVNVSGDFPWFQLGDSVKFNNKKYRIKRVDAQFVNSMLKVNYTLVSNNAFVVPIASQKNLRGRILRAQVKKVGKDKIQAHLVDIDKKYDEHSTTWFPFATPYSSADGSGWYVMPEDEDFVRIIFPTEEAGDAFASSSINTAPLEKPHNKSLKAPGGRELLLTDEGVEIIAKHQETFIKLDTKKGISVVSANDITIFADGNISFKADGKIQMVAKKEITSQIGDSHIKMLSNQIDMGAGTVIVGS